MKSHKIVDRGDGPKIEGTRITVYAIFETLELQRSREWIAATLGLSSRQVQAAISLPVLNPIASTASNGGKKLPDLLLDYPLETLY